MASSPVFTPVSFPELCIPTAVHMRSLGIRLGAVLQQGDAVALKGPLGAGKTTLTQGIACGLGVPETVAITSPTFTLVNEHRGGRIPLFHADLYRLDHPGELHTLGLDEAFDEGVVVIEWPDKFPEVLPADHLDLRLDRLADGTRIVVMRALGPRSCKRIELLL
ncbi:MAG: tRNA (adenosine(37)-N6)-threonylcarbamoyltransferase complex ATPase subunit type 1 TsaE [Deltaproteobacteria bacterium]|nr:tRNA (adenosine(37)-N6)-threonylcarbamoyltransferase complex ATPase subunit type 1 TsaE [Deltaproteobacteria bacterium]